MTADNVREPLCRVEAIADGGVLEMTLSQPDGDQSVLLLRAGEVVRAFLNICPHAGRPLNWAPGQFLVENGQLICAVHGACFTIPEGRCVSGPCRGSGLAELPVRVEHGDVYVDG